MKSGLPFRSWFYFRMGWSTYFVFALGAINTLTITYFLAIDNYPILKNIFPTFEQYVVIMVLVGIPMLIMLGYAHYKKTKAYRAYRKQNINERHRHRYEVNNKYLRRLIKDGLIISGKNEKLNLVEIVELKDHPWFVGVQFHPKLKSRIVKVHPLFSDFILSAIHYNNDR